MSDLLVLRLCETFDITRGGDLMRVGEIAARSSASWEEVTRRMIELKEMGWDAALLQATIEFCGREA